ncbi:MAG: hypothetical protein FVQ83_11075 [Chloroflexi bacterium]|nr:hypothetical protein [Chloroflexota bacterium]
MEIHTLAVEYLSGLEIIDSWQDIKNHFEAMAARKPRGWELPIESCLSVGGSLEQSIPAVTAIGCMQINIILIDDMLDEDPRGRHHQIGSPAAANLASAFQGAGLLAITESDLDTTPMLAAVNMYNQTLLMTTYGQHLDVLNPQSEGGYWEMVRAKTSPYSAASLYLGAFYGGATREIAEKIQRLGELYGEMIQIHDDMKDALAIPANPDWLQGRFALPVLYTHLVDHPDRERFTQLRKNISDPKSLEEAQEILVRCGAISYCVDLLIKKYQIARRDLAAIDLVDYSRLENMFEEVVEPVRELINSIGAELPEALQKACLQTA